MQLQVRRKLGIALSLLALVSVGSFALAMALSTLRPANAVSTYNPFYRVYYSASSAIRIRQATNPRPTAVSGQVNWSSFGFDLNDTRFNPFETRISTSNVSHLKKFWSATTGGSVSSSPAIVNGIAYVGSEDGKFYAFNASTGHVIWTNPGDGSPIFSSPAVANGVVYFETQGGNVYALDALTGVQKARGDIFGDNSVHTGFSPVVSNGVLYLPADNRVYAFDPVTLNRLWKEDNGTGVSSYAPAVVGNITFFGSGQSNVLAFDSTGCLANPVLANCTTPAWETHTGALIFSPPTVTNGTVYIGGDDGKLYVMDAATGMPLWTGSTHGAILSAPSVANGVVYIKSNDGNLYAFAAAGCINITCPPLWVAQTGGSVANTGGNGGGITFLSSSTVANGVVYVGSGSNGKLFAFSAKTGKQLFVFLTGPCLLPCPLRSSPAVLNGVVYFGAGNNNLYALHLLL